MRDPNVVSVQPDWCRFLPVQQQSVLFLGARGPDGIPKFHPCKEIQRAYRACVLIAAKYGRLLEWGERADTFMSLDVFADESLWQDAVRAFFGHIDQLPHHFLAHLMHGSQILGYKHPDQRFRNRWYLFYLAMVKDLHLRRETEAEMDERLSDWCQTQWKAKEPTNAR